MIAALWPMSSEAIGLGPFRNDRSSLNSGRVSAGEP
jgi:hypothetical protein